MIIYRLKYPFYFQYSSQECGITCLRMILKQHGKYFKINTIRSYSGTDQTGISMWDLTEIAEKFQLHAETYMINNVSDLKSLQNNVPLICHLNKRHFIVVNKILSKSVICSDPAKGMYRTTQKKLISEMTNANDEAFAMTFFGTPEFQSLREDKPDFWEHLHFLFFSLKNKGIYFVLICISILIGMLLLYITPHIRTNIFDIGVASGIFDIVLFLLLGQLIIIIGQLLFTIIRDKLVMELSVRVNFQLTRSFLDKLISLPISFFDTKRPSDILHRISDHNNIENFLTNKILSFAISLLSLIVFSIILYNFNSIFFYFFVIGIVTYFIWTFMFMRKRQKLDWAKFEISVNEQGLILQIIKGIFDLKLYNAPDFLIKGWVSTQHQKIKNQKSYLTLTHLQLNGSLFIFQLFQMAITLYAAKLCITGELTIGQMIAIEFVIGQMVSPVSEIVSVVTNGTLTRLSLKRIFDIWETKSEPESGSSFLGNGRISFKDCSYKYMRQTKVFLKKISFKIDKGSVTAIVGDSGSGKSTILKLLLGYYDNYEGEISIGDTDLRQINLNIWREQCGIVFSNNIVFNGSIAQNVALSDNYDINLVNLVIQQVNMTDFVDGLPDGIRTIIGENGQGLSQGQQQRLYIARALYKNPEYLFLDEATNALDALNESLIINNIRDYMLNRTIVIIAHRLSTVRYADNIIVLKNGEIVEEGSHDSLIEKKGTYKQLIDKQL